MVLSLAVVAVRQEDDSDRKERGEKNSEVTRSRNESNRIEIISWHSVLEAFIATCRVDRPSGHRHT